MRDMSNKSAKARFADGTDSFLTIKGVRYRIAGMRKDAKGNLVYDLHGTSKTAHPVTYTLVKFLDDQRWVLWGAQGQEVARGKMEAARPGAKATFGSRRTTAGALRKQLKAQGMTDTADFEWHGISASDPDSTPYWLHEDGSMEKIKSSRPGAKAKFAVAPEVMASLKFHTSKMNDLLRQFRVMSRKAFGDRFDPAWLAEHASEIEAGMGALNAGRIKEATSRMRAWADEFTSTYLHHAHTRDLAMLARAIAREPAHVMEVAQANGVRFSRPGAKAKMSKATDALEYIKNSIASGKIVYVTAGNRTTKVTPQAYAKWEASGKPLFKISSDGALLMASGSSYVRLTLADEMLARVTAMSRPGAKAEMGKRDAIEDVTNALAIAKRKIDAMTRQAQAGELSIVKKEIDYLRGVSDAMTQRIEKFESTGFSRPGAKAEMAIRSDNDIFDVLTEASDKGLDRHNLVREARRLRDAIDPHGVGGQAMLKHKSWPQLVRLAEQIERLPAAYARPGAKVTAGRAEDLYRQLSSGSITYANAKQWERLVTEALRLPDYTPPGGDMSLHEIAEDLGGDLMALKTHSGPVPNAKAKAEKPSDLEREDVKAGLKLMEKADKAVSDKIRTLIAEGKPQDQAVAIALDMKRRGEI